MASDQPDSFQVGSFEVRKNPSPQELADKLNRLREAVDRVRLQDGIGYTVNRSSGGTSLNIKTGNQNATIQSPHPFQIYTRYVDDTWQAKVYPQSLIYNPTQYNGTINGLNTWTDLDGLTDVRDIYLKTSISNHAIVSAGIDFSGQHTSLVDPDDGSGAQTAARIPLGSVTSVGQITQSVRSHVRTNLACMNGFAYVLLVPL
jgi:hypothetical protein